jgi:hypothetical protein
VVIIKGGFNPFPLSIKYREYVNRKERSFIMTGRELVDMLNKTDLTKEIKYLDSDGVPTEIHEVIEFDGYCQIE